MTAREKDTQLNIRISSRDKANVLEFTKRARMSTTEAFEVGAGLLQFLGHANLHRLQGMAISMDLPLERILGPLVLDALARHDAEVEVSPKGGAWLCLQQGDGAPVPAEELYAQLKQRYAHALRPQTVTSAEGQQLSAADLEEIQAAARRFGLDPEKDRQEVIRRMLESSSDWRGDE